MGRNKGTARLIGDLWGWYNKNDEGPRKIKLLYNSKHDKNKHKDNFRALNEMQEAQFPPMRPSERQLSLGNVDDGSVDTIRPASVDLRMARGDSIRSYPRLPRSRSVPGTSRLVRTTSGRIIRQRRRLPAS